MVKKLIALALVLSSFHASAFRDLLNIHPPEDMSNLHVQKLSSNKQSTEHIIFIKDAIPPHFHATHTEMVYVMEGEAILNIADTTQLISAGNFLKIEPNVLHSVKVTSENPLKVLTIHTPEFYGDDRIFVEPATGKESKKAN